MGKLAKKLTPKRIREFFFQKKPKKLFTYGAQKMTLFNGKELVDLSSHTVKENRRVWSKYDWSERGEKWSVHVKKFRGIEPEIWKSNLINKMMLRYIKPNSNILEIGPGAGRWSEHLAKIAKNLILADITKKCLKMCKKRFDSAENIEYKLISKDLGFIEDNSVDYIWSYDVFVHINPTDIEKYIKEFSRILVDGGFAIIHHAGKYSDLRDMKRGWRTFMNMDLFAKIVADHGMEIIEQNDELTHKPGDVISVFLKPENKT